MRMAGGEFRRLWVLMPPHIHCSRFTWHNTKFRRWHCTTCLGVNAYRLPKKTIIHPFNLSRDTTISRAMKSSNPCEIPSDWAWDSSYCWSLGTDSRTSITKTYHSRYVEFTIGQYSDATPTVPYLNTDFDQCLPGPITCSSTYTGVGCPTGHVAKVITDGTPSKTAICCPRLVF